MTLYILEESLDNWIMKCNQDLADRLDDHLNQIESMFHHHAIPEQDWNISYGAWKEHLQDLINDLQS